MKRWLRCVARSSLAGAMPLRSVGCKHAMLRCVRPADASLPAHWQLMVGRDLAKLLQVSERSHGSAPTCSVAMYGLWHVRQMDLGGECLRRGACHSGVCRLGAGVNTQHVHSHVLGASQGVLAVTVSAPSLLGRQGRSRVPNEVEGQRRRK